jgi:hypothetical protein
MFMNVEYNAYINSLCTQLECCHQVEIAHCGVHLLPSGHEAGTYVISTLMQACTMHTHTASAQHAHAQQR